MEWVQIIGFVALIIYVTQIGIYIRRMNEKLDEILQLLYKTDRDTY